MVKSYQGVALTPDYLPFIELMRFFTPFGIGHFNEKIQLKGKNWHNNTPYRQDITELRPQLSGKEVLVGAFIGNYDKGGHQISLELSIHPDQQKIVNNNFVLPVFNTTNVMEMAGQDYPTMFSSDKGVEVEFILAKDLKNAQLRYITTGHGGWGEGDEFVPKENSIYLDGNWHMLLHHGEQIVDPTDYSIRHRVTSRTVFLLQISAVPTGVPGL